MKGDGLHINQTTVSHITSAVVIGVAIDYLTVMSVSRNTDSITMTRHRSRVEDTDKVPVRGITDKGEDRTLPVVAVDP